MFQDNTDSIYLYRYRNASKFTLKEIENSEIFLAPKKMLNDHSEYVWDLLDEDLEILGIKEKREIIISFLKYLNIRHISEQGIPEPDMPHRIQSVRTAIDSQIKITFREVVNQLRETHDLFKFNSNRVLVSCFSKSGLNPTMLSHYADSGRGIVVAYQKQKIRDSIKESDIFLHDVEYSDRVFKLRVKEIPQYFTGHKAKTIEQELLCRKYIDWSYEEEVRLFCVSRKLDSRVFKFQRGTISGICLGPNTEKNFSDKVIKLCRNNAIPVYSASRKYGLYTYRSDALQSY